MQLRNTSAPSLVSVVISWYPAKVSNINRTEAPQRHLIDQSKKSTVRPCLIAVLRGYILSKQNEVLTKQGHLTPVLDPFSWISPTTIGAAGDVQVMHTRRKGKVLLSYPALLSYVATVLHRRK